MTTMPVSRLIGLALLHIHNDTILDPQKVIDGLTKRGRGGPIYSSVQINVKKREFSHNLTSRVWQP